MKPASRKGAVLLISLWAAAALATLAIAQATHLSLEIKWVGRLEERSRARHLAWTALEAACAVLAADSRPASDDLSEPWARVPQGPVPLAEEGTFLFRVTDEQGKIPLNSPSTPLELFLQLPGFTPQAAMDLVAARAAGKRLSHPGELRALAGYQPEALAELAPLATVAGSGGVNLNTASEKVLLLLGFSPGLAAAVCRFRTGPDGLAGSADDGLFADVERIPADLEKAFGLLLPEDQILVGNLISAQRIQVRSSFFRVEVEGSSAARGLTQKGVAVVERAPGAGPVVRSWHEPPA